jgi:hypothetical protein
MAFKGRDRIRSKIVINKITEQVNMYNYLGNLISYEKEKRNKIEKLLKITGISNNTFKPNKVQKGIRIKLYNTSALPILVNGSENGQ